MQTVVQVQSELQPEQIEQTILTVARDFCNRGPGWSQERVVLQEVAERLGVAERVRVAGDLELGRQQAILNCWHGLFRKGTLSWGYNLDNPNSPWFHFSCPDGAQR